MEETEVALEQEMHVEQEKTKKHWKRIHREDRSEQHQHHLEYHEH